MGESLLSFTLQAYFLNTYHSFFSFVNRTATAPLAIDLDNYL